MTESYTAAGQVLRSSEKACLRSAASRDRNTRRFDSASVSARVEKSCWLGRSQPGVSLAFNHLPTDAGSVVKYVFQYVSFGVSETSCVFFCACLSSRIELLQSAKVIAIFGFGCGQRPRQDLLFQTFPDYCLDFVSFVQVDGVSRILRNAGSPKSSTKDPSAVVGRNQRRTGGVSLPVRIAF